MLESLVTGAAAGDFQTARQVIEGKLRELDLGVSALRSADEATPLRITAPALVEVAAKVEDDSYAAGEGEWVAGRILFRACAVLSPDRVPIAYAAARLSGTTRTIPQAFERSTPTQAPVDRASRDSSGVEELQVDQVVGDVLRVMRPADEARDFIGVANAFSVKGATTML